MKRCALLLALIALAGCGESPRETPLVARMDTGSIPMVIANVTPRDDAAASAMMTAPEGLGLIAKVRERHFRNGSRQEIALANDKGAHGENVIEISVQTAPPGDGATGDLLIGKPSERGIHTEILARFPDLRMGVVTRPMRNAYGPFGLAIGKHADGARCVFAWQWIEDIRDSAQGQSSFKRFGALLAGQPVPASIRVRVCRSDRTLDEMASLMEGLRLGDPAALERGSQARIELWREIESERETAYLVKSERMKARLLEARKRQQGIPFEAAIEKLGI